MHWELVGRDVCFKGSGIMRVIFSTTPTSFLIGATVARFSPEWSEPSVELDASEFISAFADSAIDFGLAVASPDPRPADNCALDLAECSAVASDAESSLDASLLSEFAFGSDPANDDLGTEADAATDETPADSVEAGEAGAEATKSSGEAGAEASEGSGEARAEAEPSGEAGAVAAESPGEA